MSKTENPSMQMTCKHKDVSVYVQLQSSDLHAPEEWFHHPGWSRGAFPRKDELVTGLLDHGNPFKSELEEGAFERLQDAFRVAIVVEVCWKESGEDTGVYLTIWPYETFTSKIREGFDMRNLDL